MHGPLPSAPWPGPSRVSSTEPASDRLNSSAQGYGVCGSSRPPMTRIGGAPAPESGPRYRSGLLAGQYAQASSAYPACLPKRGAAARASSALRR
jgi:hypothetical protein